MQAPLQARNDSDAAQTETARTVVQKRVLADDRPAVVAQRKLAEMMNNSPRVLQQRALSDAIHNSPRMVAQRHEMNALFGGTVKPQGDGAIPAEASLAQREKTNKTGLPNQLKSGIESLSGMSMDHVTVHYNSDKPAQLQAHAYAQGSEIHLAAGQERHLPHEAWHVVQQARRRVRPTLQMKAGAVNDDPSLEKEADMMGEKAAQFEGDHGARNLVAEEREAAVTVQRVTGFQAGSPVQRHPRRTTTFSDSGANWGKNMEIIDSIDKSAYIHLSRSISPADDTVADPNKLPKSSNLNLNYYDTNGTRGASRNELIQGPYSLTAYTTDNNAHITLEGRYREVLGKLAMNSDDTRLDKFGGNPKSEHFDNLNFGIAQAASASSASSATLTLSQAIEQYWRQAFDVIRSGPSSAAQSQALIAAEDVRRVTLETAEDLAKAPAFKVPEVKTPTYEKSAMEAPSAKPKGVDQLMHYSGKLWPSIGSPAQAANV